MQARAFLRGLVVLSPRVSPIKNILKDGERFGSNADDCGNGWRCEKDGFTHFSDVLLSYTFQQLFLIVFPKSNKLCIEV